ncbi:unnamed protein product [Cylicocyclus nassatus]|uniref:Uncharacterized protein n=1 Tax=Cylicocyclus nassatus TaxID=53992 RepID=A0AA36H1F0_CYLNA|nr:unnamed protein product [Cylicocyclus nassatus]
MHFLTLSFRCDEIQDCTGDLLHMFAASLYFWRSAGRRTSPNCAHMTEITFHDLIPQIDSSVLIGASTRTACAQLLTVLALKAPQLLMDHPAQCDKFFNAPIAGIRDRNSFFFRRLVKALLKDLLGEDGKWQPEGPRYRFMCYDHNFLSIPIIGGEEASKKRNKE